MSRSPLLSSRIAWRLLPWHTRVYQVSGLGMAGRAVPRAFRARDVTSPIHPTPTPAVVVGADRVVANGDTANKIGTYQLAIVAKHHGVPFYVAAPSSSCDLHLETGKEIIIEERPSQELTDLNGVRIAAKGKVWASVAQTAWLSSSSTRF